MRQLLFNLYNFHEEWAYKAVSAYIKPDIRVTILPFSFADGEITIANWNSFYGNNGRFYLELIAPFKTFGLSETNIELVNYFTVTSRELQQQLMTTDIIFLTGGLPDKTNDRLKELAVIGTL